LGNTNLFVITKGRWVKINKEFDCPPHPGLHLFRMLGFILTLLLIYEAPQDTLKTDSLFLSPGRAAFLSAVIPGGGQFYTHKPIKGVIFGTGEIVFLTKTLLDYRELSGESDQSRRESLIRKTMGDLFWFIGFWGFSIVDAYVTANFWKFKEKNVEIYRHTEKTGEKELRFEVSLHF